MVAAYPTTPPSVPIPTPEITSVRFAPLPLKLDAVTTPWNSAPCLPTIKPVLYAVEPEPTMSPVTEIPVLEVSNFFELS